MNSLVKVFRFSMLSFLSFAFITTATEHPESIRVLGMISAIFAFILIYPLIRDWQKRSLNNLAHTIMAFEIFSIVLVFLANLVDERILQVLFGDLSPENEMDIIHVFLQRFFIVILFMPRFLSLYSGGLLCWKLIKNHNEGGPYGQFARLYQGSAVIVWLIELAVLVIFLAILAITYFSLVFL